MKINDFPIRKVRYLLLRQVAGWIAILNISDLSDNISIIHPYFHVITRFFVTTID